MDKDGPHKCKNKLFFFFFFFLKKATYTKLDRVGQDNWTCSITLLNIVGAFLPLIIIIN
jgi:hypothetical protein